MKILFVCHRFPYPPKRGGKIRPFNIIRHLAENHEVTVASLARSSQEAKEGEGLSKYCIEYKVAIISPLMGMIGMLKSLFRGRPLSMGYFYSETLKKQILKELSTVPFDLIFVHCSSVAQYVEDVHWVPKILDFGDMDSKKWQIYSKYKKFPMSIVYALEGRRLELEEKVLASKFNMGTCTTLNEKLTLESYGVGIPTAWFPNGVDSEYFAPTQEPYAPNSLCFIGRMDYYPNQEGIIEFCQMILPLIKEKCPQVVLTIIGADPSREILDLAKIQGVTVTGSVPDVRPFVLASAVNVVPLNIARGTQNKILESLSMGVPTVTTSQAATGVDAIDEEHFLVASTHQEFANAVVRLISNPSERMRFSRAGRERMLDKHNWSNSMKKFDTILAECLETSGVVAKETDK